MCLYTIDRKPIKERIVWKVLAFDENDKRFYTDEESTNDKLERLLEMGERILEILEVS